VLIAALGRCFFLMKLRPPFSLRRGDARPGGVAHLPAPAGLRMFGGSGRRSPFAFELRLQLTNLGLYLLFLHLIAVQGRLQEAWIV